jgi:2-oxoglutarate ferredoxin oxidoreductase subunit alpha
MSSDIGAAGAVIDEQPEDSRNAPAHTVINDCVITVATSNGTGSQSANLILMRTIFNMGVPVSGKNMFPSNIQGLPTWFTVRASKDGWTARREDADILVAMNPESVAEDIAGLKPGATLVLHEDLKQHLRRDDLDAHIVPFGKLVVPVCPDARLRRMVVNIMYVGVLARLVGLDLDEMKRAIQRQFAGKPKAAGINEAAAMAGHEWAAANLADSCRHSIRRDNQTAGKIIVEGNAATAIGLMFGGVQVVSWYPITPSSSIAEALTDLMARHRADPATGRATYAIVQSEDELAAMAMVVGAGWAGARAATCTSGPGISLMAELAGLSYFCEIPAVVVDVQRVGPSTGLPTRTSQGDILKAYYLSHGDAKHVLLIPATVREAYDFAATALDLAERLQTLVLLMSDLDLGMNSWMSDPFDMPAHPVDRGKVLDAGALEAIEAYGRYKDVDGDGIGWRTLPGTRSPRAPFFTQGAGHDEYARRSEKPHHWSANLDRLARKHDTARSLAPGPVADIVPGAKVALMGYGSSDPAIAEARHILRARHGVGTDYLRVRALPAAGAVRDFIAARDRVYLVEQNRDAQMACILRAEFPELARRIHSVLHYNGLPLDAHTVVNAVVDSEAAR